MKKYFLLVFCCLINFPVIAYDFKEIKFTQKKINVKENWNFFYLGDELLNNINLENYN